MPIYCENAAFFMAEPLNTVTNAAFLVAAYGLWRVYKQAGQRSVDMLLMIIFLTGTGLGSAAWHATQARWGLILDVVFIQLFMLTYLIAYIYRYTRWTWWQGMLGVFAFVIVSQWTPALWPFELGRGSSGYLPAWGVLGIMAWHMRGRFDASARWLVIAFATFIVSLSLRTLDMPLCLVWPWGLHFLWHILNAIVLYAATRGFWQSLKQACRPPQSMLKGTG
jgi:hypothetical protein